MALLAAATTTLVLVATWGGHQYDWASPQILGLAAATVVLGALFVIVENRAVHPVIPMSLFKDRDFTLTTVSSLMIGIAMFGAIGYMPTYLQMVTGANATEAGLLMIPMMGGLLLTSVISGQVVSTYRQVQGVPDRRVARHGRRPRPAVHPHRRQPHRAAVHLPGRPRHRHRHGRCRS